MWTITKNDDNLKMLRQGKKQTKSTEHDEI